MSSLEVKLHDFVAYYMQIGFPETVKLSNGDTDDICLLCGMWCTQNSAFNDRYNYINGYWVDEYTSDEEDADAVPICDKCFDKHDLDKKHGSIIEITHRQFWFDCPSRVND